MGKARFRVTYELLCDLLRLPSATAITHVEGSEDGRDAIIYVDSPDIPSDDGKIFEATPVFERHEPIEFVDWGFSIGG